MIPAAAITHWSTGAPWSTRTQVEQDLLLSRLICEIANHPYLGEELVFRGGTCFHKLHIHPARRYSEDLDYVRSTAGGIKEYQRYPPRNRPDSRVQPALHEPSHRRQGPALPRHTVRARR